MMMKRKPGRPRKYNDIDFIQAALDDHHDQIEEAVKRERQKARSVAYDLTLGQVDPKHWTLDDTHALERIIHELRHRDGDSLAIYEPVPDAKKMHECLAGEVGLVGANRAGKSVASAVEVAWAATGTHPVAGKYPDRGLEIAIVGPREEHLRLLYYLLFKRGKTFKVLELNGQWVIPKYSNPEHMEHYREWQDARPLIPERMVTGDVSWIDKKREIPAMVTLENGTVIYFFSFESDPPRGVAFDLVWFDEEARNAGKWLTEMRFRMVSKKGRLFWSATPENATVAFFSLKVRADSPKQKEKPIYNRTMFFEMSSRNNPFLDPEGLAAAIEKVGEDDPDMAQAKVDGEFAFKKYLVYPEFDENKHVIDPFPIQWTDTVYAVVDPSRTRCGIVLFAILAPQSAYYMPTRPNRMVVFDHVIVKGGNAFTVAKAFAGVLAKYKHWIEDITIDWSQGRKADEYDVTIAEHYWREFKDAGIEPRLDRFVHRNSNLSYGIEEVSKALVPKDDGPPNLVMFRGKTDMLIWEFKKYHRIKNPDLSPGKPFPKGNDLVDCVRYACCRGYEWVTPPNNHVSKQAFTQDELRKLDNPREFRKFMWQSQYGRTEKPRLKRDR